MKIFLRQSFCSAEAKSGIPPLKTRFGSKYFKVCRLLLIQIGDNYPCTETMPKSATGYETTILTHGIDASASKDKKRDGQASTYEFTVTDLYIVF